MAKKNKGERIQIYLNDNITEDGLLWINKRLKNNKLNPTLIHLINKAAEQEKESLGNEKVTSASDTKTDQSEIVKLLASLVQNGQIVINTGQTMKPNLSKEDNSSTNEIEKDTLNQNNTNMDFKIEEFDLEEQNDEGVFDIEENKEDTFENNSSVGIHIENIENKENEGKDYAVGEDIAITTNDNNQNTTNESTIGFRRRKGINATKITEHLKNS